ncbi:MAG: bifunctional oligoribonuclease/PAP phosphatase NrnA [Clostridia bacterium]|nr:bifunctional oligoribonuclease/PAP phosphatase NrnA [Clostridia bacterium]
MSILQSIYDHIRDADCIMLFRHIRVDGDCVGATKGLKEIIRQTWPEKQVYLIDDEHSDYLAFLGPDDDPAADEVYANALGIVIDVGNHERISNQKYRLCRKIIKIDHHIERDPYGDINWVEEDRSSACEMIAAFYDAFRDKLRLNVRAAECIYTGMVTDSGRFMYEGVTGETMRLAGLMLDQGIDTETLYSYLYLRSFDELKFKAQIYESMQLTPGGVAWIHVTKEIQKKFGLTFETACTSISSLSDIRGVLCWLAFIDAEEGEIRVRLRSRFASINQIAEKYHGGGHACASGATVYSIEEMHALIHDADEHIRNYKETHEGWL